MSYWEPPIEQKIDGYMVLEDGDIKTLEKPEWYLDSASIEKGVIFEPYGSERWPLLKALVAASHGRFALGMSVSAMLCEETILCAAGKATEEKMVLSLEVDKGGLTADMVSKIDRIAHQAGEQVIILANLAGATSEIRKKKEQRKVWDDLVEVVKAHKNLKFGISGFAETFSDEDFPHESGQRLIEEAIGYIGTAKYIFGTGFPALADRTNYAGAISLMEEDYHIPRVQKKLIMYLNAQTLFFQQKEER